MAELHELGTLGLEERRPELLAWFPSPSPSAPVLALADPDRSIRVHGPVTVPDADWEAQWRHGLEPRRVGPLWIRPSWCESQGEPELVIDPQRAFGSGEHATTRLSLAMLLEALREGDRVLDLGSGSGILGLAALRLGAGAAVGIDNDPVACRNARDNAAQNGLPLVVVCGTLDSLRPSDRYDLVVANMLWSRLEPWVPRIARTARRVVIVSGFLAGERGRVEEAAAAAGLAVTRAAAEAQSGDVWGAFWLDHASDRQR